MTFYYRLHGHRSLCFRAVSDDRGKLWLADPSVHRWSASMMVLIMILHTFRVY